MAELCTTLIHGHCIQFLKYESFFELKYPVTVFENIAVYLQCAHNIFSPD